MKTIFKYPVKIEDKFTLSIPIGSKVLCFQIQNNVPCIWALVDSEAYGEDRFFEVHGTGNQISEDIGIEREYIGTIQHYGYVWHLFERTDRPPLKCI